MSYQNALIDISFSSVKFLDGLDQTDYIVCDVVVASHRALGERKLAYDLQLFLPRLFQERLNKISVNHVLWLLLLQNSRFKCQCHR